MKKKKKQKISSNGKFMAGNEGKEFAMRVSPRNEIVERTFLR